MRPLLPAILLLVLVSSCASKAGQGSSHPAVGVTTQVFQDKARHRELTTEIWYPAPAQHSDETETYMAVFTGHAARDVPMLEGGSRPLIVMSHGSGSFRQDLAWLAEGLAREGFIVAATTHPHNNTGDDDRNLRLAIWERPLDLSFVIGALQSSKTWGGRVDAGRVGAAGFSLGGYSVLALGGAVYDFKRARQHCLDHPRDGVCVGAKGADRTKVDYTKSGLSYRDARVRAILALAPAVAPGMDPATVETFPVPLLVWTGTQDQILDPLFYGARWKSYFGDRVISVDKADHYTFVTPCNGLGRALPLPVCQDPPGLQRRRVQANVLDAALTFFQQSLSPKVEAVDPPPALPAEPPAPEAAPSM